MEIFILYDLTDGVMNGIFDTFEKAKSHVESIRKLPEYGYNVNGQKIKISNNSNDHDLIIVKSKMNTFSSDFLGAGEEVWSSTNE